MILYTYIYIRFKYITIISVLSLGPPLFGQDNHPHRGIAGPVDELFELDVFTVTHVVGVFTSLINGALIGYIIMYVYLYIYD